jgi:Fe/S biogenesis protein NfuA
MVKFTEAARAKIAELLAAEGREGSGLRLSIVGRLGGQFQYRMALVRPGERAEGDVLDETPGFALVLDARSAPHLDGTVVDYVEAEGQRGFRMDNPNPLWADPLSSRVQALIDEEINPALASHGGFVHLLELRDGVAYVELGGGCRGCGMARVTIKSGVEVREVVDVTDHAGGTRPYFGPAERGESPYS